jgi:hypothetical protein
MSVLLVAEVHGRTALLAERTRKTLAILEYRGIGA